MELFYIIKDQIKKNGNIPFVEFMSKVLYTPTLGYYNSSRYKFGQDGDFITAPELTSLFGQTLAYQCQQIFSALHQPIIFEFGAGSGQLCIDILIELEQMNLLPEKYYILEVSGNLCCHQQELIQHNIPHLLHKVCWLKQLPAQAFDGVIIANEVLDAFPVHRFLKTQDGVAESHIILNDDNQLQEIFIPVNEPRLLNYLQRALPTNLPIPYLSEANLLLEPWLQQCYSILRKGVVLLIDYGFPRHEYYHPDRFMGTLMCHRRQRIELNPFIHLGQQDITAHIDFTHVAEAAQQAGFHIAGFTNQAAFLLGNNLLNLFQLYVKHQPDKNYHHTLSAIKTLLDPSEMGELFKVMALGKQLDLSLNGFHLQDKRVNL